MFSLLQYGLIKQYMTQNKITIRISHRRGSHFTKKFRCPSPICNKVITMKFCTWHDSCDFVACSNFCSDMICYNGVNLWPMVQKFGLQWKNCTCASDLELTTFIHITMSQLWVNLFQKQMFRNTHYITYRWVSVRKT